MEPEILYEDQYILALDKPSGFLVHGDGKMEGVTLVDWINENHPNLIEIGEPQILSSGEVIKRPGIVHRLDRETSGVILIAKTQESHQFLKRQFQDRKVEKIYNAVVWGNFAKDKLKGVIDKPIGRSSSDFRQWSAEYGAKGKMREATTEYEVLFQKKFKNPECAKIKQSYKNDADGEFSYIEVRPKTGRTHQIRVHLKSISHPVVCDKLYASSKICDDSASCLYFSRLALHALSIKLQLPNHTLITIESSLPSEFEKALCIFRNG